MNHEHQTLRRAFHVDRMELNITCLIEFHALPLACMHLFHASLQVLLKLLQLFCASGDRRLQSSKSPETWILDSGHGPISVLDCWSAMRRRSQSRLVHQAPGGTIAFTATGGTRDF